MVTTGTDSCWSWVIAAACCWVTFVIQGLVRSGGVVYVALIDTYAVSRAQASWPFTLRMAIWNLSGPLAGALSYRWSIRSITFAGVLLVTITNMICWFLKDIYLVTFFLGGVQGLGVGLAVTLVPVMINQYFVKYKSTGAGIACAGATAGSFALPPVVEFAIEEYGLGGAFLVMGGITLHGILGASLMRPAAWIKKNTNTNDVQKRCLSPQGDQNLNFLTSSNDITRVDEVKTIMNGNCNGKTKLAKHSKTVRFSCEAQLNAENEESSLISCSGTPCVVQSNGISHSKNAAPREKCEEESLDMIANHESMYSEQSQSLLPTDISSLVDQTDTEHVPHGKLQFIENESDYDPQINLKPVYLASNNNVSHQSTDVVFNPTNSMVQNGYLYSQEEKNSPKWLKGLMEPFTAAGEIVKNPMFLIIASNYSIFFLSYMTYLIIIVDYSLDLGIDRTDCVFLVSTFSIADLIGRLGSGWITDSGIVKRKHLMMGNMVLVGGLLVATSFATTYAAVTAVSVCTGLVVGVNLILFYALLEEYLGLKQLPMAIGLMNFSIGVISLVTPLLTGYFRDTMGSYDHLFHLLGGVSIFCGLLWTLEPLFSRCKRKADLSPVA